MCPIGPGVDRLAAEGVLMARGIVGEDRVRRRTLFGAAVAFLVIAICFVIVRIVDRFGGVTLVFPPPIRLVAVLLLVGALYFNAVMMWRYYSGIFGRHRRIGESILDTGLLSVGKYIPGKIWGLMARGAISDQGLKIDGHGAFVSLSEQLITLALGCVVGAWLLVAAIFIADPLLLWSCSLLLLVCGVSAARLVILPFLWLPRFRRDGRWLREHLPLAISARLGAGYGMMWLLSGASFALVAWPVPGEGVSWVLMMGLFVASSVVGWMAILAPAGIGIREASFAALAAPFVPWQQALAWIMLHRLLLSAFDLVFGMTCLVIIGWRARTMGR